MCGSIFDFFAHLRYYEIINLLKRERQEYKKWGYETQDFASLRFSKRVMIKLLITSSKTSTVETENLPSQRHLVNNKA